MKICRNCSTVNDSDVKICIHCAMENNFEDISQAPKMGTKIKNIHRTCKNCGTSEMGSGTHCAVCNFPIEMNQRPDKSQKNMSS